MRILEPYFRELISDVYIDESPYLAELIGNARSLRNLPFEERLQKLKELAVGSMVNAFEALNSETDIDKAQIFHDIIYTYKPLSYALEHRAGCCRYHGALFFVLGYEADLGDRHFIQYASVSPRVLSVFNDVFDKDKLFRTNIFYETLKNKSLDYTSQNPKLYDDIVDYLEGEKFFSYHRQPDGKLLMLLNAHEHIKDLKSIPAK